MPLVAVAVPVPFLDLLAYNVPESFAPPPVGARVRVPVGPRVVTGVVAAHGATLDAGMELKDVVEVLDREPFLPAFIVDLCVWVADYYMAGIGDAIGVALPPGARNRASAFKTRRVVSATVHGLEIARQGAGLKAGSDDRSVRADLQVGPRALTGKQRAALEVLAATPSGLSSSDLRERGMTADVIRRLAKQGYVSIREERDERDPFGRSVMALVAPDATRVLTGEQQAAFDELAQLADQRQFRVALLHGVTGSGKTEVYLRVADRVCRAGRQVLVLVPEIALTPSVAALFRGAFGTRVAIQHSALSDGERHDQWQRIRRGEVDVVIGTRSAVFAPLDRVGLVIVDEEHDGSYKQEESPRYHGRDVAIVRASREGALVVLGSATPSMETYQNAVSGKYSRVTLARRVLDRPLAHVRLVNMRDEYAEEGPDVVISRELAAAVEDRLTRREQVLILLNRRGYSTAVFCRQCGDTFDCPNCSVSLTVHRARQGWRARCHYCNYSTMVPKACRKCAAPYLEQTGFGTEKVEQHLRDRFPDARIGRIDRDSVRRRGALIALLSAFAAGELDVLVGTQMIAKGHDFPRVTLVGVISADVGLGVADFRAGERTFQLLTQVAGRAGRGDCAGEAIVQTLYPGHYSIQLACRQDYPAFFERELGYRRGMRYPPAVALISGVVRGRTFDEALSAASDVVGRLEPSAAMSGLTVLGPAPAPLGRLRGEHRVQFFLKGTRRAEMRVALRTVVKEMPEIRRRLTIDVDPLSVL
jgi:primosomal protein N' (replication factor Y)